MTIFPELPLSTDEQRRKSVEMNSTLHDILDEENRQFRQFKVQWFARILYETSRYATVRSGQELPDQSWEAVPDIEKIKLLYQAERILSLCDIATPH